MSINKVILVGNVGQEPEIRNTQDGREIASFSVATTESWKDKNSGEKKEKTEWHRIAIFSPGLVSIVKSYVKKGSKIYIEGSLQTRKWTDNAGLEKYSTEVVLQQYNSTLQILDARERSDRGGSNDRSFGDDYSSKSGGKSSNISIEEDDEIPF